MVQCVEVYRMDEDGFSLTGQAVFLFIYFFNYSLCLKKKKNLTMERFLFCSYF